MVLALVSVVDFRLGRAYSRLRERYLEKVDNEHRAKLPEDHAVITLSGRNSKLINGSPLAALGRESGR